jgi:hypothetical protein
MVFVFTSRHTDEGNDPFFIEKKWGSHSAVRGSFTAFFISFGVSQRVAE